jgi:hypothetical protein
MVLLAIWPSPVNADECFAAAGFTDFGDSDATWDAESARALERLIEELRSFGEPALLSEPIAPRAPVISRIFAAPPPLPLLEQITLPTQWDSCPDCVVAFGEGGVTLRTGSGHMLYWVTLPAESVPADGQAPSLLARVAGAHPLLQTTLDWTALGLT